MRAALALARRGLGNTCPNPSVGCVIVARDGRVVGRGRTAPGGRPHAEAAALAMAGAHARGATAYVTLEPCCHAGRGPPCAQSLVEAGVARVVVALVDPDPRVAGQGNAILEAAGVAVEVGLLRREAVEVALGFLTQLDQGRPTVTLKLASTLDGRIAARTGDSRWITGAEARRAGHMLRATHDAVMVGVGTVLADDPDLTCRVLGARPAEPPLVRVVVDSRLRTPPEARLVATGPTWLLTRPDADPARREALRNAVVVEVPPDGTGIDLGAALRTLSSRGVTRLLVEGGAQLAAGLLRHDLVDRVAWFHAPGVLGGDGLAGVAPLGLDRVADLRRFVRLDTRPIGADTLTLLARKEP